MEGNVANALARTAFVLGLCFLFSCRRTETKFSGEQIKGENTYLYSNELTGEFLVSTDPSEVGKKITVIGLDTTKPKVIFESGWKSEVRKVFENDETVSLVQVAGSGGIDAFSINKKTGVFSRSSAGNLFNPYAAAALGRFK
jgi:hypothetical protein